jgi:hypothetical protein
MPVLRDSPPQFIPLKISAEMKKKLEDYLVLEIQAAISARAPQEKIWKECLRQYAGIPRLKEKNFPIENAPNLEIVIAAIAADAITAQALDAIFTVTPIVTVRATKRSDNKYKQHCDDLQDWVDWLVANELNLRESANHVFLDDTQLGTGIYYTPWVVETKKTKLQKIIDVGARSIPVPIEDFIVPGGKNVDIQKAPWVSMRLWLSKSQLSEMKDKPHEWNIDLATEAGALDQISQRREAAGRTTSQPKRAQDGLYEIHIVPVLFDIDKDGIREDLWVVFDRTAQKALKISYNPYDNRPFDRCRYQIRTHLFYGMGVPEMLKGFQDEITDNHNERNLNQRLANTRCFKSRFGTVVGGTVRLWANRNLEMMDPNDLMELKLSDEYTSAIQAESVTMALAERRVGLNDLNSPARPSQMFSSRTPATTSMNMLAQVNKRFTPAFDDLRFATAGSVKQALFRYRERVLMNDTAVLQKIEDILGAEKAANIVELFRDERFEEMFVAELTAGTASVNRDVDRQNAITLANLLAGYYQKALELVMVASNPQTPPAVKEVATKIATAANEVIERVIRTFDQVRDPHTFIIEIEDTLDKLEVGQQGLAGLGQIMAQIGGNGQKQPAPTGVPA